jgi:HlyD family secretion protein
VLKLFGNVEIRQVLLGFRVPGRLEKSYYEEGTEAKPGALLGELDSLPYEIKRAEALAALRQARANLGKMESGYRSEEVRQAAARRDQIRASLTLAEKDHERLSRLFSQDAVSKKALDDATSARDGLRAELASAESALALVREGFRAEDIAGAEAAAELAEARLREAQNSLDDTKLYAPAEGTILTRVAEPGTVLSAVQPVYALMLKKPVHVRAYVTEPQLGNLRLGMKGKIFTDSHPGPLEGTVAFIASEAEFTPKQVQTEDLRAVLVYRVRLLVEDNPGDRLKNGMPVTVFLE